jgi:hypothetical protein
MEIEKLRIQVAELKNSLAQAKQNKTLRDEFAMAALVGQFDTDGGLICGSEASVRYAYEIADLMLKERAR